MRLFPVFAVVLAIIPFHSATFSQNVSGTASKPQNVLLEAYKCSGESPRGKYTLPLKIKRQGENYFLFWGQNEQLGIGIRTGDTLSLFFSNLEGKTPDGKSVYSAGGVAAYTIGPGILTGKWAVGDGNVYIENCSSAGSLSV